jgi:hypothetical protein
MNTGLAIIIARTKTHPEEFMSWDNEYNDWAEQIEAFKSYMTDEEKAAWKAAVHDLVEYKRNKKRDDFTEYVMKKLAGVVDTESVPSSKYTENLAMSMKNTKQVLEAGLMKTFAEQYKHEDFVNAMRIEE